jgi:hypothetical protein
MFIFLTLILIPFIILFALMSLSPIIIASAEADGLVIRQK